MNKIVNNLRAITIFIIVYIIMNFICINVSSLIFSVAIIYNHAKLVLIIPVILSLIISFILIKKINK